MFGQSPQNPLQQKALQQALMGGGQPFAPGSGNMGMFRNPDADPGPFTEDTTPQPPPVIPQKPMGPQQPMQLPSNDMLQAIQGRGMEGGKIGLGNGGPNKMMNPKVPPPPMPPQMAAGNGMPQMAPPQPPMAQPPPPQAGPPQAQQAPQQGPMPPQPMTGQAPPMGKMGPDGSMFNSGVNGKMRRY